MESFPAKTLLLVEDEAIIAYAEQADLVGIGYRVEIAVTFAEARTFLLSARPVDLVLMDINLDSGHSGIELAEEILQLRDLPVIFLSSHTSPEIVSRTEAVTSYGYIVKSSPLTVVDASIKMAFRLHEARQRLTALYENMSEGVALHDLVFDDDGRPVDYRIADCNPRYEQITSISRIDAVGRLASDLYGASPAPYLGTYAEVALTRKPHVFETYFPPLGIHFEISVAPWRKSGFATIFSDVTERVRLREALEKSEETYRTMFEATGVVGYLVDPETGTIVDANAAACRFYGYGRDAMIGLPLSRLHADDELSVVRLRLSSVAAGGAARFLCRQVRADGAQRDVDVFAASLGETGGHSIFSVVFDISDRVAAQDALKRSVEERRQLFRELQHRIKNSFAIINSFFSLGDGRVKDEAARGLLERIRSRIISVSVLYELLDSETESESLRLDDYLRKIVASLVGAYGVESRGVRFDVALEAVSLDIKTAGAIGLIVNELLTNSLKHAFPARSDGTCSLTVAREGNQVRVRVCDDGVGFPPEIDPATAESTGLQIVRALTEQLEAELEIGTGPGTCFSFRIGVNAGRVSAAR